MSDDARADLCAAPDLTTEDDYCEHGYVLPDAPHPAAGCEKCPEGCTDE